MREVINNSARTASSDVLEGKLSIVYVRLQNLRWLPGTGNDKVMKEFKHWKMVIRIGLDCFTLEFVENSLVSWEGLLTVGDYNPDCYESKEYPLADLNVSTEVLWSWIKEQFEEWRAYNVAGRNCHSFVRHFLGFLRSNGHVANQTDEMWEIVDAHPFWTNTHTGFVSMLHSIGTAFRSTSS
ncbi:hypothetical protein BGX29_011368 [Mortierella sp. GBA35]|nr:hypothetical protein BGX29_011368 [Mortierella sp. GBA35]